MATTGNIDSFAKNLGLAIKNVISTAEKEGSIQQGTVSGGTVYVNGRAYTAVPVVDLAYSDGDTVLVQINYDGGYAAIVGR